MLVRVVWAVVFGAISAPAIEAGEAVWPMPDWPKATPAEVGMDEATLIQARDYALGGDGSGMIVRHGRLVFHWGDLRQRYDLKSTTKSFGAAALGLALEDGKIKSLVDNARLYHPTLGEGKDANAQPGWLGKITIGHLLMQTAGFEKPGGTCKMLFEPGTKWAYSDSGPNWLAECITLAYKQDLNALMFERLFTPIGIKPADLTWRTNSYRPKEIEGVMRREFGAGISANVDAMARFGYLFLRRGRWQDQQLLPEDYVLACGKLPDALRGVPTVDPKTYGKASEHYGYLWWNNADGMLKDVPRDAYVYVYSHDSDSAYKPADRMVLARVPKEKLVEQSAYEFFQKLDADGKPVWTGDVRQRGGVFEHPGRCYRSGITYNAGLKRYLWCQIIPGGDTRSKGGFGIYDAPEPWGPWTTAFFTENWDVGPGETSSLPTKWMSADGRTVHLVFSGDDCFSVRRATLSIAGP